MHQKRQYYCIRLVLIFSIYRLTYGAARNSLCPTDIAECECNINAGMITLDCSSKALNNLPNFEGLEFLVHSLDLSNNQFTEFPLISYEIPLLSSLDLSNNQITTIPEDALKLLPSLRFFYMNNNNIANWADIRPNTILQSLTNLETFSLSGNPLTSFTSIDQSYILASSSLKLLDLSDCKITKVTGQFVLQGLPKLEHLILSGNPLRSISDIISESLLSLDLSNCKLASLQPFVFNGLPLLTYVNLAQNHRLSLTRKVDEYVQSDSIKRIDLSRCNMDAIEIGGFPNLMTAILRGNLINKLRKESFERNPALENIDLSSNSITHISSTSFRELPKLKNLDLSFNMIRRIERDTFKDNEVLTSINLSRNFVERFSRMNARSLTHLNMSWCEVLKIDLDAFNDMPELVELDLSSNLFSDFPPTLQSNTLQTLDLSMCRISTIRNNTFEGFPELSRINLAGNRFTTMFHKDYFSENPYLRDIWLGDNPWRCDCHSKGFFEFFNYLLEPPAKVNDHVHLRCISPEDVYGLTWDMACSNEWLSKNSQVIGTAQKVWTFLMVGILIFTGSVCLIMSVRRCIEGRKLTRREEERLRNLEESRDVMRRNRSMLEQEAQLNAPDPRETRPPCYEDAILLPRLNGSFSSLWSKRKIEDTDEADGQITRRNRSRSEEVLSQRESVSDPNRITRRQIIAEANNRISIFPVLEIPPRTIGNNEGANERAREQDERQQQVAGASVSRGQHNVDGIAGAVAVAGTTANVIQNFDNSNTSPYAQRKSVHSPSNRTNTPTSAPMTSEINIVEDHYSTGSMSIDSMSVGSISNDSTDSSSQFTVIN